MKQDSKNIDDLFKDELGDYTETPPSAVWTALEKKLHQPKTPRAGYRNLGYGALLLLGAAVSILIAGIVSRNSSSEATNNKHLNNDPIATAQPAAPVTGNTTPGHTNQTEATKPASFNNPAGAAAKQAASPVRHNTQRTYHSAPINKNQNAKTDKQEPTDTAPVYNAPAGNSIKGPAIADNNSIETAPAKPAPTAPKKEAAKTNAPAMTEAKQKNKPAFKRFEAGIKAGYEGSFNGQGATKAVVSPYLQFNLSPKFSIMTQPSVKYAHVTAVNIGNSKSYYKENTDSTSVKGSSNPVYVGATIGFYLTDYTYTQSHDSIVKSYTHGGVYMEFDVPLLLKYAITKKFSVYGGLNLSYSKLTGVQENTYEEKNIVITKSNVPFVSATPALAEPQPVSSEISYSGAPITAYTGPLYSSPTGGLLRYGYMFGFSYEYSGRWLFDGLVQQTPVNTFFSGGYNVNTPISAPYFRLTLGYKLIK